jgi:hypothetical protein
LVENWLRMVINGRMLNANNWKLLKMMERWSLTVKLVENGQKGQNWLIVGNTMKWLKVVEDGP